MQEMISDHTLGLTEEEAMGLLEIVMMSPMDLSAEQRTAIMKLGEFCRERLRESAEPPGPSANVRVSVASAAYAA